VGLFRGFEIAIPGTVHTCLHTQIKHAFFVSFRNGFNLSNITTHNLQCPAYKWSTAFLIRSSAISVNTLAPSGQFIGNSLAYSPPARLLSYFSLDRGCSFGIRSLIFACSSKPVLYIKQLLLGREVLGRYLASHPFIYIDGIDVKTSDICLPGSSVVVLAKCVYTWIVNNTGLGPRIGRTIILVYKCRILLVLFL